MTATRIRCKQVRNLSPEELGQCLRLSFDAGTGRMRDILRSEYERERRLSSWSSRERHPAQVLLLREIASRKLLAWCLIDNSGHASDSHAYIYVRASCRRQGLGRRLIKHLLKTNPRAKVCPHDECSRAFFASFPKRLKIASGYSLSEPVAAHLRRVRRRGGR